MKRILILEDDFDLAMHWKTALEELGHAVTHTRSGEEAIRLYAEEKPALVISDILIRSDDDSLEKIGGLTFLCKVCLNDEWKTRMIAISGSHPSLNVLKHAASFGATTFMKPVALNELVAVAVELLGEKP